MKKKIEAPLLLLHGFPLDSSMWDGQVGYFKGKYPVLSPDLPGFGKSAIRAPETIEGFAEEVKSFLDENNVAKIVLIGFSMGGYIALAFYEMFPNYLEAIVLADTRAAADSPEGRAGRNVMINSLKEKGMEEIAKTMAPKLLSERGMKNGRLLKSVREMMVRQRPDSVKNALIAMRERKERSALLEKIDIPALFICGEEDLLTPPSEMKMMAERVKNGSFALIKGAGHLSNMEEAVSFNETLSLFLEKIER